MWVNPQLVMTACPHQLTDEIDIEIEVTLPGNF